MPERIQLHRTKGWRKPEGAIRRWEAITREAPSPTEPGARGNPRLAAPFSEWMQGLAARMGYRRADLT